MSYHNTNDISNTMHLHSQAGTTAQAQTCLTVRATCQSREEKGGTPIKLCKICKKTVLAKGGNNKLFCHLRHAIKYNHAVKARELEICHPEVNNWTPYDMMEITDSVTRW